MSVEKWRTSEVVHQGEITLDPTQAREKLRDYRLPDPHRWILEVIGAANAGGANRIEIDFDSDEYLFDLHGVTLSEEDLATLWQAPFQKHSRPTLRRLAFGLIAAEALQPRRIVIRSGGHEAVLSGETNRSLVERIITQKFPEDELAGGTRIYIRLPLSTSRMFGTAGSAPEYQLMREHARFSDVPLVVAGKTLTVHNFGAGARGFVFDQDGMRGSIEPVVHGATMDIHFLRHGVETERISVQGTIPATVVVDTDRVDYDLSGLKVVRNKAFDEVAAELQILCREALLERIKQGPMPDHMLGSLGRLMAELAAEAHRARLFYEDIPPVTTELLKALRIFPLWLCAGRAPARAPFSRLENCWLVSLADASPDGRVHVATSPVPGRFGDRPILLVDGEEYVNQYANIRRDVAESVFQITATDVTQAARSTSKRLLSEERWRTNRWGVDVERFVEPGTYLKSDDAKIEMGYVTSRTAGRFDFLYQRNVLLSAPGVGSLYVVVHDVHPNSDFTGPDDDDTTLTRLNTFIACFPRFLAKMAASTPTHPMQQAAPYKDMHLLAADYLRFLDSAAFRTFGVSKETEKPSIDELKSTPLFCDLKVGKSWGSLARTMAGKFGQAAATSIFSFDELAARNLPIAFCTFSEAERMSGPDTEVLLAQYTVVIGDDTTSDLLRAMLGRSPDMASTKLRQIEGKSRFESQNKVPFQLPSMRYLAKRDLITTHGNTIIGLTAEQHMSISMALTFENRIVEEVELTSRGGAFQVITHDSRLTISSTYDAFVHNDNRLAHEREIIQTCADIALEYVADHAKPMSKAAAALYTSLLTSGDRAASDLEVLWDTQNRAHSFAKVKQWSNTYYVRDGFAVAEYAAPTSAPILVLSQHLSTKLFQNPKDVSDSPEMRARRDDAKRRFYDQPARPAKLTRAVKSAAPPGVGNVLATASFHAGRAHGEVALTGLVGKTAMISMLREGRDVGQRTLAVPFGLFEVILESPDIILDGFWNRVVSGADVADEAILEACGRCLLTWLKIGEHHAEVPALLRMANDGLKAWSAAHLEAGQKASKRLEKPPEAEAEKPEATVEQVKVNEPNQGAQQRLARLMEEIRGNSQVFANVAFRGFVLKELGTGLPAQAEGNVVDLDPTHPTIDLALKTEDPVWHAMAVSTGYTAMNLHWLAITDDHEAEFHERMIAHLVGLLGETQD
ncbi:MAG: hypothetical protein R3E66_20500 [bacterium]